MIHPNPTALLRQKHIDTIHTLFLDLPPLRAVAQASAQAHLDEHFALRRLTAEQLYVRLPSPAQAATDEYQPLADALVARLANGEPTLYVLNHHDVVQLKGGHYEPVALSLFECEGVVNECGALLLASYQEQLQAGWKVRWLPLVEALKGIVSDTPTQPGMSERDLDTFFSLSFTRPGGQLTAPAGSLRVSTVHIRRQGAGADEPGQALPLLLLKATASTAMALYSPASGVHLLNDLDAIGPLLADHLSPLLGESPGEWFVCDYTGPAPEALASSYLARQLAEIDAIDLTVRRTAQQCQDLLNAITDTRRWFVAPLSAFGQGGREAMPTWLFNASQVERVEFAQRLCDQVGHLNRAHGERFFPEIPSLAAFAEAALQGCLDNEPQAISLKAQDIHLVFGPPDGEPLELTLPTWALESLGGFARTPTAITLKGGEAAPTWLTFSMLEGWREHADLAKAYSAVLNQQFEQAQGLDVGARLWDEEPKAWDLYNAGSQMISQLYLSALMYKIRGLHGLTQQGYQMITELGGARAPSRLFPLALGIGENNQAVVQHLYVLTRRDMQPGICVLFTPLLHPVVQEFISLEEVLAAIQQPGPLRDGVLAWLPADRRALFEPHLTDVNKALDPWLTVELNQDPTLARSMRGAFLSVLQALAEWPASGGDPLHWASFKSGGWSLPYGLTPLVQGADTLTGWLGQLMSDVRRDVPGYVGGPRASIDLLGNLAWLLAHEVSPANVQLHLNYYADLLSASRFAIPQVTQSRPKLTRIPMPRTFTQSDKWGAVRSVKAAVLQARQQVGVKVEQLQADYDAASRTLAQAEARVAALSTAVDGFTDTLTQTQVSQVLKPYHHTLHVKLKALSQQLQTLKHLRALVPRLGYEAQICALLESIVQTARLLADLEARHIVTLDTQLAGLLVERDPVRIKARHDRLVAYKWSIALRDLETRHLDELRAVIGCGAEKAQALTLAVAPPSVLALQAQQLRRLWQAAWCAEAAGSQTMFSGLLEKTLQRAMCASQSHAGFNVLNRAERIELLTSVVQVYGESIDQIEFCTAVTPQAFDLGYLGELQTLIGELYDAAEHHLLATLADPVSLPSEAARGSLIRTRSGDVYQAHILDATEETLARTAQVRDIDDEVIAIFRETVDALWHPMAESHARFPSPPGSSLADLIKLGQQTIAQIDQLIAQVINSIPTAKCAHLLPNLLEVPARLLEAHDAILVYMWKELDITQQALAQPHKAAWLAAAARLHEQEARVRLAAIKAHVPVQAAVEALLTGRDAVLLKQPGRFRVDSAAHQFVQFYRVQEVPSGQPLAYIHLHYPSSTGCDDVFIKASLNTCAQHHAIRQTQPSLSFARWMIADAASVLASHRSEVGEAFICRWMDDADSRA
ncbi:hypothetical protein HX871_10560 [Pseudomonas reactans]|uniref:Uncharacterized protein n=1 Tax=Pseudomonas reactans TaxID=117680 RepID=A0ABX2QTV5_9PSED|nr:hypothetical protein [Pseudomonas reactans]NWA40824.1 hypothetical protein [Pseudomonas reactans]NWD94858.1 hypothetical protein [Pseudomonas reactans]